jgi:hypothetical protein
MDICQPGVQSGEALTLSVRERRQPEANRCGSPDPFHLVEAVKLLMPRVRTYRSEAIVLRRVDFGEADRMLTLYSREFGKIRALAKGARKPQTRKAGHIELFMRSDFMFAEGRSIDIVTQAELVEPYAALRNDLVRTTYAAYAAELIDGLTAEAEPKLTAIYPNTICCPGPWAGWPKRAT